MLHSLQDIRHAEAQFVAGRHHIARADLECATEYSGWVINQGTEHISGRHPVRDPLLVVDTLAEVSQFAMQIQNDALAMRSITAAFDLSSQISEKQACASGWPYGFTDLTKAKIAVISDIFSEEPAEETYEAYRQATDKFRLQVAMSLSREMHLDVDETVNRNIGKLIGRQTELTILDAINNANRARRVNAFALHTGIILDECDVYLEKKTDDFRLSSDIELLSEDLEEFTSPQPFIQVKRSTNSAKRGKEEYSEHLDLFNAEVILGREELQDLEKLGFKRAPKPLRENVRKKMIDFITEAKTKPHQPRAYDRIIYKGQALLR